ncbi:aspartate/glutamate racemase family protein [Candidatus Saccharibacteria bacterium]|nr:aspartate/glutamate racemase family protein [Candidatus Saccharibacteria bacterium]
MKKIGIFDSGVGGKKVELDLLRQFSQLDLRKTSDTPGLPSEDSEVLLSNGSDVDASVTALKSSLDFGGDPGDLGILRKSSKVETILLTDQKNLPYGSKTPQELIELIWPFIKQFEQSNVDLILIACNTVTTNLIDRLRQLTPIPLVGFEPAIKLAASQSKTGSITVCATSATLGSHRYQSLIRAHGKNLNIYQPDCTDWARLIESSSLTDQILREIVDQSIQHNADIILLGCTHYHWIEDRLNDLCPDGLRVIQPTEAVFRQIARLLKL